jgi:ATP-dependent RNA helicase RhlE
MSFKSLGLSDSLLKAVAEKNYTQPYPIQQEAIPAVLAGKDIFGIAQTGSGKTASFVLPVLQLLQKTAKSQGRYIRALVLVPTRELAVQVTEVFKEFGNYLPEKLKIGAAYGGVSINPQMKQMMGTDILIATPGRLLDLIASNAVHLSSAEILVLDEADKMLNLGFKEEMNQLFRLLPKHPQTLLFSATPGDDVNAIKERLLKDPVKIQIEPERENLDLIKQSAWKVSEERKGVLLRYLIKNREMTQVLVFVSSVHKADHVVVKLKKNKIDAMALHSKKTQGARTEALSNFKKGKLRVLVATDLASRGIDIKFLPFVINYELPRSPTDYVHRIGRTGRAESPGEAISLITPEDEHHFKIIQKKMGRKVEIMESEGLELQGY